jgi:hypothetical protein
LVSMIVLLLRGERARRKGAVPNGPSDEITPHGGSVPYGVSGS